MHLLVLPANTVTMAALAKLIDLQQSLQASDYLNI